MRNERSESKRQGQILACIMDYLDCYGYPPTFREMSKAAGKCSTSVVKYHLTSLERNGEIDRDDGVARAIRLTTDTKTIIPPVSQK